MLDSSSDNSTHIIADAMHPAFRVVPINRQFCCHVVVVSDIFKRFHDGVPIDCAIFNEIGEPTLIGVEPFDMHFRNTASQRANPVLWVSVQHDVPYIEIGGYGFTFKLVKVTTKFYWAEQKFIQFFGVKTPLL